MVKSYQSSDNIKQSNFNKLKKRLLKSFKKFVFCSEDFDGQKFVNHLKLYLNKIDIIVYNEFILNVIVTNLLLKLNYCAKPKSLEQIQIITIDNKIIEMITQDDFPDEKILK